MNRELVLDELSEEQLKELNEVLLAEFLKEDFKDEDIADEDLLDEEGKIIEDAKKLTYKDRKELKDSDFALIQYVVNKKTGEKIKVRRFPIFDPAHIRNCLQRLPQAKNLTEEERKLVKERCLKKAKELNMTELLKKYEGSSEETKVEDVVPAVETKPEEEAQAVEEPVAVEPLTLVRTTREEKYITVREGEVETRKGLIVTTTEMSDGSKQTTEETFEVVDKYTQAEVDEKVNVIKVELEKTYNEQLGVKDSEIATLKAELETKNIEITTIKTEQSAVIEKENADLGIGSVNVEEKEKDIEVQNRVTAQAFPVKK